MTKKFAFLAVAFSLLAGAAVAQGAQFKVGDYVLVGSVGEKGTVIAVGQAMANGGTMIRVHLDRLGDAFAAQGVWYDSMASGIQPTAPAPPPQPLRVAPAAQQPAAQFPAAGAVSDFDPSLPPPPNVAGQ